MARDRFYLIAKFFHFNDNNTVPADCTDKLYKIKPVFDFLINKWQDVYTLGEHISIDQGTIKWRGKLSGRVYLKDKSTKHGIKSYILTDSTSGYCWNMLICHQLKKNLKETVKGLLGQKCLGLWHTLYMNDFFNSVELSEALLLQKIHTVGTLQSNRGEPDEIGKLQTLKKDEVIARSNGKVMVLAWRDNKLIKAISTKHDGCLATITRRKRGTADTENVWKPACIIDYNQHIARVNQLDQKILYYPCTRKTLKWTKKLFFYLLEITIHNCHILYQAKSFMPHMTLYDFQLKLLKKLCHCVSYDEKTPPSRAPKYDPRKRLKGGFGSHHITAFPATATKKYPQRKCRVCRLRGNRKDTRFYCKECGVPLCKAPCFGHYHSEKELK